MTELRDATSLKQFKFATLYKQAKWQRELEKAGAIHTFSNLAKQLKYRFDVSKYLKPLHLSTENLYSSWQTSLQKSLRLSLTRGIIWVYSKRNRLKLFLACFKHPLYKLFPSQTNEIQTYLEFILLPCPVELKKDTIN